MAGVMADAEEGFTLFQRDPSLILVIAEREFAAKVQFHLTAIAEGDLTDSVARFKMLIRIG